MHRSNLVQFIEALGCEPKASTYKYKPLKHFVKGLVNVNLQR